MKLHAELGVYHTDLESWEENMVINDMNEIRIIDFGDAHDDHECKCDPSKVHLHDFILSTEDIGCVEIWSLCLFSGFWTPGIASNITWIVFADQKIIAADVEHMAIGDVHSIRDLIFTTYVQYANCEDTAWEALGEYLSRYGRREVVRQLDNFAQLLSVSGLEMDLCEVEEEMEENTPGSDDELQSIPDERLVKYRSGDSDSEEWATDSEPVSDDEGYIRT